MDTIKTSAIIKIQYKDKEYVSIPICLDDNSEETILVMTMANQGTDGLNLFKMPIDENEFVVFSRKQLDEAVFIVKIIEENMSIKVKKKPKEVKKD